MALLIRTFSIGLDCVSKGYKFSHLAPGKRFRDVSDGSSPRWEFRREVIFDVNLRWEAEIGVLLRDALDLPNWGRQWESQKSSTGLSPLRLRV